MELTAPPYRRMRDLPPLHRSAMAAEETLPIHEPEALESMPRGDSYITPPLRSAFPSSGLGNASRHNCLRPMAKSGVYIWVGDEMAAALELHAALCQWR